MPSPCVLSILPVKPPRSLVNTYWPGLLRRASRAQRQGLIKEPEPGYTAEDGKRTFALSEIMVCQPYTGQHIAHALHDELLTGRHEARATALAHDVVTALAHDVVTALAHDVVAPLADVAANMPVVLSPVSSESTRSIFFMIERSFRSEIWCSWHYAHYERPGLHA